MVKKMTILLACCSLISFNLYAQKETRAFNHLSVGLELGTTGIGLEVAAPVHPNFTLRGGFSMLPFTYSTSFDIEYDNYSEFNEKIDEVPGLREALEAHGLPTNTSQLVSDADLDAKLGLLNGKLLMDIYPSTRSSFHFVAGVYFGKSQLINVNGYLPGQIMEINSVLQQFPEAGIDLNSGVVIGDYTIRADENGKIDAGIKINSVKPYLGLGFGRSVPKKRVGCQFELGAMFHGKPKVVSSNSEVSELLNSELDSSGITDIMNKITVYPVLSFRIIGRIF